MSIKKVVDERIQELEKKGRDFTPSSKDRQKGPRKPPELDPASKDRQKAPPRITPVATGSVSPNINRMTSGKSSRVLPQEVKGEIENRLKRKGKTVRTGTIGTRGTRLPSVKRNEVGTSASLRRGGLSTRGTGIENKRKAALRERLGQRNGVESTPKDSITIDKTKDEVLKKLINKSS